MLKFRPTNRTSITFNEQQLIALIEKGLSDNSLRGFLYKRSSTNSKWRLKWFLLFENLLFYFDVGQSQQQIEKEQLKQQQQLLLKADKEQQQQQQQQHQHQHQQANYRPHSNHLQHHGSASINASNTTARQDNRHQRASSHLAQLTADDLLLVEGGGGQLGPQLQALSSRVAALSGAPGRTLSSLIRRANQPACVGGQQQAAINNNNNNNNGEAALLDDGHDNSNQRQAASAINVAGAASSSPPPPPTAAATTTTTTTTCGPQFGSQSDAAAATPTPTSGGGLVSEPQLGRQPHDSAHPTTEAGGECQYQEQQQQRQLADDLRLRLEAQVGVVAGGRPQQIAPAADQHEPTMAGRGGDDQLGSPGRAARAASHEQPTNWAPDLLGNQTLATTSTPQQPTTTTASVGPVASSRLSGSCSLHLASPAASRTQHSSSIAGVSGHFGPVGQNEQTIGRSTTTTAGKTATANYSSLLNRKIGLIFLEGSYCERLVDSPVVTEAEPPSGGPLISSSGGGGGGLGLNCRPSLAGELDLGVGVAGDQHLVDHIRLGGSEKLGPASKCPPNDDDQELLCMFTLKWRKQGSKEYQFRTETEAECQAWVHAISKARYSSLLNDKEQLEQKYLHLSQIIESESTAKWQYSRQCEELSAEIKKLQEEVCLLKRQEGRTGHLRSVLERSIGIVDTLIGQQHQHQQAGKSPPLPTGAAAAAAAANQHQVGAGGHHLSRLPGRLASTLSLISASSSSYGNAPDRRRGAGAAPRFGTQESLVEVVDQRQRQQMDHLEPEAGAGAEQEERAKSADFAVQYQATNNGQLATGKRATAAATTSSSSRQPANPSGASPAQQLLIRAKSMEQEQADHELAVRRIRRRAVNARYAHAHAGRQRLRMASLDFGGLAQQASTLAPSGPSGASRRQPQQQSQPQLEQQAGCSPVAGPQLALAPQLAGAHQSSAHLVDYLEQHGELSLIDHLSADAAQSQAVRQLMRAAEERGLSLELKSVVDVLNKGIILSECLVEIENSEELRKIKKVQGFFRGWLCRRRWKQIVQEYIKSPHAESMRKRNNLVFKMVECEEEYVEQLTLLISAFLRPLKMAASSQRPALDHDELNSIFLNSETLLFLHQIFLKGLTARMESWPTLVLGDLFNMLLPMLTIYQEYVRNHHFSLQVLAECKQREQFAQILRRLEEKPQLNGRTLETFLTYPMHQIPRYIICLHEILAHTPHNHVERRSLYEAQTQLEALSCQMHDEVSETENIRQNLAIERMIVGGCDLLLDVNQVFVRQGILLQAIDDSKQAHQKSGRSRLSSFSVRVSSSSASSSSSSKHNQAAASSTGSANNYGAASDHQPSAATNQSYDDQRGAGSLQLGAYLATNYAGHQQQQQSSSSSHARELVRQCFLFTNHMLLCTRTKEGKLRPLDQIGRISLAEVTLIENPLEFVQQHQHETLMAESNFHQQQQQQLQQLDELNRMQNLRPDGASAGTTKRASTSSVPSVRWSSGKMSVTYAASNELPAPASSRRSRTGSHSQHQKPDQSEAPKQQSSTKSASLRSGIASYLASKLSNLANLSGQTSQASQAGQASQASQQQQQTAAAAAASMPSSPAFNKRWGQLSSAPVTPLKSSLSSSARHGPSSQQANSIQLTGGGAADRSARSSLQSRSSLVSSTLMLLSSSGSAHNQAASGQLSSFEQTLVSISRISHAFNGCDFLLLVESKYALKSMGAASSAATATTAATTAASSASNAASVAPGGQAGAATELGAHAHNNSGRHHHRSSSAGSSYLQTAKLDLASQHATTAAAAAAATFATSTTTNTSTNATITTATTTTAAAATTATTLPATAATTQHQQQQMLIIHLVAPSLQEKTAWISDISQCIDNVHFNDLFQGATTDSSTSVTMNQSVRADPRLHKDDVDIKFSRALNSCKLPQIRYASKERLFERLTDLRFLSIDFLNTFLLTYRVFTTAEDVLEALKSVHYNSERYFSSNGGQQQQHQHQQQARPQPASGRESFASTCANYSASMTSLLAANSSEQSSSQPTATATAANTPRPSQPARVQQAAASSPPASAQQQQMSIEQQTRCPLGGPVARQQQSQQEEAGQAEGHCKPQATTSTSTTTTTSKLPPPQVPPRSPNSSATQHHQQQQQQQQQQQRQITATTTSQLHLSATGPLAAGQSGRRSTISALTPITGSNSSSLVNLAKNSQVCGSAREIQQQQQQQQPPNLAPDQNGGRKLASGSTGQPRRAQMAPRPPSTSVSSNSTNYLSDYDESSSPQQHQQQQHDLSPQALATSELSDSDNPNASTSTTTTTTTTTRRRSDRYTRAGPTQAASWLLVPGGRQARAHSLCHVAIIEPVAAAHADEDHQRDHHQQQQQCRSSTGNIPTGPTSGSAPAKPGEPHWRLAYKKSSAALLAPVLPPARRKSAADADSMIKLQVTPAVEPNAESGAASSGASASGRLSPGPLVGGPLRADPAADDQSASDYCVSDQHHSEGQWGGDRNFLRLGGGGGGNHATNGCPTVPPSTPVYPLAGSTSSLANGDDDQYRTTTTTNSNNNGKHLSTAAKHRRRRRQRHQSARLSIGELSSSSPSSGSSDSNSSSGSDSSDSSDSSASSSSSRLSERNKTDSADSSRSESGLIQSDESAGWCKRHLAADGLRRPTPTPTPNGIQDHECDGRAAKTKKKKTKKKECHSDSRRRPGERGLAPRTPDDLVGRQDSGSKTGQQATNRRQSELVVLKEIELTQARMLDCDTSADDSDANQTATHSEEAEEDPEEEARKSRSKSQKRHQRHRSHNQNQSQNQHSSSGPMGGPSSDEASLSARLADTKLAAAAAAAALASPSVSAASETRQDRGERAGLVPMGADGIAGEQQPEGPPESLASAAAAAAKPTLLSASNIKQQQVPIRSQLSTASNQSSSSGAHYQAHQQQATTSAGVTRVTPTAGGGSSSCLTTPRSSFQHTAAESLLSSKAGVVVTSKSPRVSSRRSSTASAASAFAAATAASCNPLLTQPKQQLLANQAAASSQLQQQQQLAEQANCSCQQLYRGSISSSLGLGSVGGGWPNHSISSGSSSSRPVATATTTAAAAARHAVVGHHPSCIHFHTMAGNQMAAANNPSDCSSNNSRANSRLSSCAGLEYSSGFTLNNMVSNSSLANLSQQQHQQQQQQQQQHQGKLQHGTTRCTTASPAAAAATGGFGGKQAANLVSGGGGGSRPFSSASSTTVALSQAGQSSKRNSQAQLHQHQQHQQHLANQPQAHHHHHHPMQNNVRSMATLRVLSVLRHWVSKHSQDFVNDTKLAYMAQEFLQDLIVDSSLLPAEHKAACQLQQMIQKAAHMRDNQTDLDTLLAAPTRPSPDTIETLSALEIAETMTYLDHKIFLAIKSEEFLGQAWMKADKAIRAPHILLITKRFNDVSRLVSSEIIRVPELHRRVQIIEKWTNVAHICRVIHNFNGVLQICAAFTNSAVFRLKKTWDKIPKTTKATIDQLQNLVSTDSRFRNMRDAINRCDPPSIPYVGMYLTDLSFIEEGTPNYSPEGLLNFSKMRMIAHVIREIQHLQNGVYKLNFNTRVANYLLDGSRHLQDDEMYRCSLAIEPRSSGAKNGVQLLQGASGGQPPPPPPPSSGGNHGANSSNHHQTGGGQAAATATGAASHQQQSPSHGGGATPL